MISMREKNREEKIEKKRGRGNGGRIYMFI
jgi:hypothetical protein